MRQLCLCAGTDVTVCLGHWVVVKMSALAQKASCLYVTEEGGIIWFTVKLFLPEVFFFLAFNFFGSYDWDVNNEGLVQCLHFLLALYLSFSFFYWPFTSPPKNTCAHLRARAFSAAWEQCKSLTTPIIPHTKSKTLGGKRNATPYSSLTSSSYHRHVYAPDTGCGRLSAQSQK